MKIGVQMYTIRDYLKTPKEIGSSLKRLKEMGFDMVQISGLGDCDFDELAAMFKDNGIQTVGTHSPWERIETHAELDKLIEEHLKLGCEQVGIGMIPGSYPNTYDGYSAFIEKLNETCDQTEKAGLTFGYHNHELEFQKFNGVCAIDRMMTECPKLELTLDVFWVQAGGACPSNYVEKYKNRIRILHLKDFRVLGRERQNAELGEGNLDWKAIFSHCAKIPYAVIEQDDDFLVDPFSSLEMSKKFLVESGYWA
ncbi:MAG: sugar phosphate isomerase/epimerase [Treponema sp.]|jgi:sugar phosphate isomerase/epimerase|nr:sugar phosphate isomerase/epimerase [Treponema sp.]